MADKQPGRRSGSALWMAAALTLGVMGVVVAIVDILAPDRGVTPSQASEAGVFWAIAAVVVAVLSIMIGAWAAYRAAVGPKDRGVAERAARARDHLSAASRLLNELEDELAVRIRVLEQHQADAERYEQLASLNAEQAKAIEGLVGRQFARQSRMTWLQWFASLMAAFALGLVVNWISAPALEWVRQFFS